ncbi:hypothetical protein RRG08_038035 [Elysia crispata]|uniref:Uncharacterized protein n=1 Tax=Elysia crispata TaxID=231223 RepID=A0AAE0ZYA4_9GAST|nr:hypothetical protein RRG08_038035 [Elysia crispata]
MYKGVYLVGKTTGKQTLGTAEPQSLDNCKRENEHFLLLKIYSPTSQLVSAHQRDTDRNNGQNLGENGRTKNTKVLFPGGTNRTSKRCANMGKLGRRIVGRFGCGVDLSQKTKRECNQSNKLMHSHTIFDPDILRDKKELLVSVLGVDSITGGFRSRVGADRGETRSELVPSEDGLG